MVMEIPIIHRVLGKERGTEAASIVGASVAGTGVVGSGVGSGLSIGTDVWLPSSISIHPQGSLTNGCTREH
jgi:hypothetical protein